MSNASSMPFCPCHSANHEAPDDEGDKYRLILEGAKWADQNDLVGAGRLNAILMRLVD